ncbi:MAG TPA: hypothetical protein VFB67_01755 [Candidatus Polarisedimenticolaceae bacterium]|nr:hypothetical protein [Candidatus Polarisedimenticolaceae bacterium]
MTSDARRLATVPVGWLVPVCGLAGMCLAMWPAPTAAAILVVASLTILATTSYPVMAAFFLFLVFQDPLQVLAGGESTWGLLVKRTDEPLVILLGLVCLAINRSALASLGYRKLGLFIALCFAGLLLSSIPPKEWFPAGVDLALFSKPFLLFAIGLSLSVQREGLQRRLDVILWVMLACIAFGVVFLVMPRWQDAYVGDIRAPDERLGFLSAQGFFLGPGTYSWFAAATFAIAYAAYLAYKRMFHLCAALASAAFVALSWRRKSIIAVMAMILVSLLVRGTRGSRARSLAVLGLSLALVVTVFAPYVGALWTSTMREYGSADPYASARGALYYTSVLIARDHFPLGAGLASFGSHASKLYYSSVYTEYGLSTIYGLSPMDSEYITDTFWPMVLGEGGVFCLAGYLAFFGTLVAATWSAARRVGNDPRSAFVATAALLLLVGSLLESIASHIYGSSLQAALVLIPAGLAWRAERDRAASGTGG